MPELTIFFGVMWLLTLAVAVMLYRDGRWWQKHAADCDAGWGRALRLAQHTLDMWEASDKKRAALQ